MYSAHRTQTHKPASNYLVCCFASLHVAAAIAVYWDILDSNVISLLSWTAWTVQFAAEFIIFIAVLEIVGHPKSILIFKWTFVCIRDFKFVVFSGFLFGFVSLFSASLRSVQAQWARKICSIALQIVGMCFCWVGANWSNTLHTNSWIEQHTAKYRRTNLTKVFKDQRRRTTICVQHSSEQNKTRTHTHINIASDQQTFQ